MERQISEAEFEAMLERWQWIEGQEAGFGDGEAAVTENGTGGVAGAWIPACAGMT